MGIKQKRIALFLFLSIGFVLKSSAQLPVWQEYRIALLLPFKTTGAKNPVSEAMMDYHEGFSIAAKELEKEGLKAKIYVFDSEKDSFALETILKHPDLPGMDMIVGPVYEKGLAQVEEFCIKHKILLVSPLKYYTPQGKGELINFFVPDTLRMAAVVAKAGKTFPKHRFYVVQDGNAASKLNAAIIMRAAKKYKLKNVKVVTLTGNNIAPAITRTDSVVLISAISAVSAKTPLNNFLKNRKKSWLFASPDWHGTIKSAVNLNEPKVIYPEMTMLRPGDSTTSLFADEYYDDFYSDPSIYAYIGYDQAQFLLYGYMAFGDSFWKNTIGYDYTGLINHIKLEKPNGQLINTGLHFIRIIEGRKEEFEP